MHHLTQLLSIICLKCQQFAKLHVCVSVSLHLGVSERNRRKEDVKERQKGLSDEEQNRSGVKHKCRQCHDFFSEEDQHLPSPS